MVSQQQTARMQLRKIHNDKVAFETNWEQYLRQLAQTLEAQTKERTLAIQAFAEAEESWTKQLKHASAELAHLAQESHVAPVEFTLDSASQEVDKEAADAQIQLQAEKCTMAAAEQNRQLQLALQQASDAASENLQRLAQAHPCRESSRTPRRKRPASVEISDDDKAVDESVMAEDPPP